MREELSFEETAPWLVILITLVGGVLRILLLGQKGMWLDETFSVWLANHPVPEMLHWIVTIDQHPPLYYLLLRPWMALRGDSPQAVRMLSVFFGTITIPMIYLIGKRMSGALLGLAASLILAVSPFHIRFAQETRMYTMLTFNASVAIYALLRLLTDSRAAKPIGRQFIDYIRAWLKPQPVERDRGVSFSYKDITTHQSGWRGWISRHRFLPVQAIETDLAWTVFILFTAATMLTHNTAILFPIATNIFVIGLMIAPRGKKSASTPGLGAPSLRNWIIAQIGILILWSPWSVAFVRQVSRVYQEFWLPAPTWETIIQAMKSFLNQTTIGEIPLMQGIWIMYALALGLGLLYFRKRLSLFLFLAALFAIPFLGELMVSIRRPIFYDKTLIWTTIPLFLILAAGISQLRYRLLVFTMVGVFGTINLMSAGDYFRFYQKEDWATPAGYVANFAEEGDLVLFNASWVQIPFDYYFESYEKLYKIEVVKHGVPEDMFASGILERIMTEEDVPGLLQLVNGRKRAWLVYSHNWYTDPEGLIPETLALEMEIIRQREFYGGVVQLYGLP